MCIKELQSRKMSFNTQNLFPCRKLQFSFNGENSSFHNANLRETLNFKAENLGLNKTGVSIQNFYLIAKTGLPPQKKNLGLSVIKLQLCCRELEFQ